MGSPLIKRLDALYQRAQMVMKVQADHAPFVSIAPWSFMKNECIVKYYPEGHYQKPEQITTTLHDALMIAQYYYECGVYVQFTMSLCIEWLFLYVRDDPRYSPPQQKSWYTKNVEEYPEIKTMLESEQRFEIVGTLRRLPQIDGFLDKKCREYGDSWMRLRTQRSFVTRLRARKYSEISEPLKE